MPIFDNGPWDLPGGADHLVSSFDYLNASDRLEAARVRATVEEMFAQYPASAQEGLRRRLRSIDNNTHISAFFELALHELLLRSGCHVLAVEPGLEGTLRSPDFLAQTQAGQRFYLEATLATGRSQADEGANRRLREALQAIDAVQSPDFFLDLHISGMPTAPVSGAQLRRRLQQWLGDMDYQQVAHLWNGSHGALPVFQYEQHGVRFRVSPVPRGQSRGTIARSRAIAGRTLSPLSIPPQVPIRNSVLAKATRYGELDAPYIVAVNAMSDYADAESANDASFGTLGVSVRQTPDGFEERETRSYDGAWRGAGGPINTRVSAVLSTERLTPWSIGQRRARLVLNPWARYPLTGTSFGVDVFEVRNERLNSVTGASLRKIFGLPEGWPE